MNRFLPVALALLLAGCAAPRSAADTPKVEASPLLVPLTVGTEWHYRGEYEGGDYTETVRVVGIERVGEHVWAQVQSEFVGREGPVIRLELWRNGPDGFHRLVEGSGETRDILYPFANGVAPDGRSGMWSDVGTTDAANVAGFPTASAWNDNQAVCYSEGQDGLIAFCFVPGIGLVVESSGYPKELVRFEIDG